MLEMKGGDRYALEEQTTIQFIEQIMQSIERAIITHRGDLVPWMFVHSSFSAVTGFPGLLFPSLIFNSRSGMFTEMLI